MTEARRWLLAGIAVGVTAIAVWRAARRRRRVLACSGLAAELRPLAERALELAAEAVDQGNHPFAAILFKTASPEDRAGWIVECVNQVNQESDLTAHAEIVAIRRAGQTLNLRPGQTLRGYSMMVVADPCPMCMGAVLWAQVDALYFLFHRDAVALAETRKLGPLYLPRFSNKNEMYQEVMHAAHLDLHHCVEFQEPALTIYRRWSLVPK